MSKTKTQSKAPAGKKVKVYDVNEVASKVSVSQAKRLVAQGYRTKIAPKESKEGAPSAAAR